MMAACQKSVLMLPRRVPHFSQLTFSSQHTASHVQRPSRKSWYSYRFKAGHVAEFDGQACRNLFSTNYHTGVIEIFLETHSSALCRHRNIDKKRCRTLLYSPADAGFIGLLRIIISMIDEKCRDVAR